jgi:hypothetical protein
MFATSATGTAPYLFTGWLLLNARLPETAETVSSQINLGSARDFSRTAADTPPRVETFGASRYLEAEDPGALPPTAPGSTFLSQRLHRAIMPARTRSQGGPPPRRP